MKFSNLKKTVGATLFGALVLAGNAEISKADNLEIFMDSTVAVDTFARTITLPFFRGSHAGEEVLYIVLESSDREDARARGVNWSPKLANALGSAAVQAVGLDELGNLSFSGSVDFSPERVVVPGDNVFPPAQFAPGSIGDAGYTPLISGGDGVVLNAPQIGNDSGLHDKVIDIDPFNDLVTLELTPGFYHDNLVLYLSTDASDPLAATLEASTFAPLLDAAPGVASSDPETSARAALALVINGESGEGNPNRQGIISALTDGRSPLNILEIHPRNRGSIPSYSPLWDIHPAVWTEAAIAAGQRVRLEHHRDVAEAVEDGLIVSGGMGPENPLLGGLRAAGFVVNCPVMTMSSETRDEL